MTFIQTTPLQTASHSKPLIQEQVPLADKNWFATGGNARFYAEPRNDIEFQQAVAFAAEHTLPIFVLGSGANILISDEGFDGLVIRPQITTITHTENGSDILLTAGAGATIEAVIDYSLAHNMLGLEEFAGIPGTVGGSVYINLHYFEFLLDQFLVHARVINKKTGAILTVNTEWFNFGYNQSTLHDEEQYVIDATFILKKASDLETAYARGRRTEIVRHRVTRYPTRYTCGSFFRNFHDNEVTLMSGSKKLIFVAYYLDKIGVKGALNVGSARVSHQHANMIVHDGTATSTDIITLVRTLQEKVRDAFGIIPQPECRLIGFKEYPLLK